MQKINTKNGKMKLVVAAILAATCHVSAQSKTTAYPQMAAVDQYLMPREAEIAMARSAAPESISKNAEIMVMGRHGYTTAVKGSNGFVCMVERAWTAGFDDPEFWNPKLRAPICFNPPGSHFHMGLSIRKTEWALAGRTKTEMAETLKALLARNELPKPEPGSMAFMMSKQGYLNDRDKSWYPHLMLFVPHRELSNWGSDLPGSPIFSSKDEAAQVTVFFVPVNHWSDGSNAPATQEHAH